jgi:signal recognition particle subunit SRP54
MMGFGGGMPSPEDMAKMAQQMPGGAPGLPPTMPGGLPPKFPGGPSLPGLGKFPGLGGSPPGLPGLGKKK